MGASQRSKELGSINTIATSLKTDIRLSGQNNKMMKSLLDAQAYFLSFFVVKYK